MSINNRTLNLGKLSELKSKRYRLRVRIDGLVKNILVHFQPLDLDMEYLDSLNPGMLQIYVSDIEKFHRELKSVAAEIKRLQDDLGESSDQS